MRIDRAILPGQIYNKGTWDTVHIHAGLDKDDFITLLAKDGDEPEGWNKVLGGVRIHRKELERLIEVMREEG